jgi:transposase
MNMACSGQRLLRWQHGWVLNQVLRKWLRQAEVNAEVRPGVPESENVEIRRLKKEVVELRLTNDILRTASAVFAAEIDRPQTE